MCGILGLIAGVTIFLLFTRTVTREFESSKGDLAKVQVDHWNHDYKRWIIASRSDKACDEIKAYEDIGKFVDKEMSPEEVLDPWGHAIQLLCEDGGVKGFYSFGENGKDEHGDGDDIKSWQRRR